MLTRRDTFKLVAVLTIILYLILLFLIKLDAEFTYRWPLFFFYLCTLLFIPSYLIYTHRGKLATLFTKVPTYFTSSEGKKDIWWFSLILVLTILTRFLFLKSHPFLTWGDELWETGLDSLSILTGKIRNFYITGVPDAYRMPSIGYIQSLIPIPFAPFFAHTPYMYRIPAALIGSLDVILIYFVCRKYINRTVGLFASFALIALPIHISFSRTEVVIISNAFVTTLMICLLFLTCHRFFRNTRWLAIMGLWMGFVVNFQTASRVMSLVSMVILHIVYLVKIARNVNQPMGWITKLFEFGKYVVILLIFAVIGFGPKLLFVTPKTFIHSETSVLFQDVNQSDLLKLAPEATGQLRDNVVKLITERYPLSFFGFTKEPLTNLVEFHYTEEKPLLPPLLAFLFFVGLVSIIWIKSPLLRWFGLFALLIPLTHSALTPEVNWSYRLFIASSSLAVLIGVGLWQITSRLPWATAKYVCVAAFSLYLFDIVIRFFILEPHMVNRPVEEYMTTHLSYFLASHLDPTRPYRFCMRVAPEQLKFMDWVHAHNHHTYFVPQVKIAVSPDPAVPPNTLFLEENCHPKEKYQQYIVKCSQNLYSICPQPTVFRQQYEPNEIEKDFVFNY